MFVYGRNKSFISQNISGSLVSNKLMTFFTIIMHFNGVTKKTNCRYLKIDNNLQKNI